MRAQIRRITRLRRATTEHLLDDGLHVTILVAWLPLLEGLPVIAEDLLEGVFVDPLACGDHSARLYHVLAAEASRFFALLSPSLPIASPVGAGRIRDLKKGNSYTLELDDDRLDLLKEELIDIQHIARDQDGRMLVWTGGTETPLPASVSDSPSLVEQVITQQDLSTQAASPP